MNVAFKPLAGVRKSWLLVEVIIVGGAFLGLGARAVVATGQGADFGTVLNEPSRTADDAAEIVWSDGEPLLRELETQTIEGIEFAWTRALAAVGNAAEGGDTSGLDVWFSGPAQDQVSGLIATGAVVDGGSWLAHDVTPSFYSIDGQILVANIERTAVGSDGRSLVTDNVRAVFVLRDGNWRVEHLTLLEAILR